MSSPPRTLILVDIQNDFCPGGALAVREGDAIIAIANHVQPAFEHVVTTQDWHPKNHGSFAANHPGRAVGEVIDLNGLSQVLWPVHCVQGTHGAEFHPALDTSRVAKVFQKGVDAGIDSYSGLYDNGHRRSTGLGEHLHARGVKDVTVVGLATDYCVKFTALDVRLEGFDVTLIEDAMRGVNLKPTDSAEAVEEMRRAGVRVIRSGDVRLP